MNSEAHTIAGIAYGGLKAHPLLAEAYTHPPIATGEDSQFSITKNGKRFKVTVREISEEEEIAAALRCKRA